MTPPTKCWVELSKDRQPVRIFRSNKAAHLAALAGETIARMPYRMAVEIIRRAVFCRDKWKCTHGGEPITWTSGHMHERQPRGKIVQVAPGVWVGGEVSLDNGTTLCYSCHMKTDAGHGKRQVRFGN